MTIGIGGTVSGHEAKVSTLCSNWNTRGVNGDERVTEDTGKIDDFSAREVVSDVGSQEACFSSVLESDSNVLTKVPIWEGNGVIVSDLLIIVPDCVMVDRLGLS